MDLLRATRHVPQDRMAVHYGICRGLGITRARDGLPSGHPIRSRLATAASARMSVAWDLHHFDIASKRESERHARHVGAVARQFGGPLWICPMNEPSIVPLMSGSA